MVVAKRLVVSVAQHSLHDDGVEPAPELSSDFTFYTHFDESQRSVKRH